jgi:hypothetical protein
MDIHDSVAEMAFANCGSLRYVYIEDLGYTEQDSFPIYKHYQRQNDEDSDEQHSGKFVQVAEEEVHAWWMPHWSRY